MRLARRAGSIVVGVKLTRERVRRGEVAMALVADDLSAKRRERLLARWRGSGVSILDGWTKEELGEIAGKAAVAVLGITDRNIAAGIAALDAGAKASENREESEGEE